MSRHWPNAHVRCGLTSQFLIFEVLAVAVAVERDTLPDVIFFFHFVKPVYQKVRKDSDLDLLTLG